MSELFCYLCVKKNTQNNKRTVNSQEKVAALDAQVRQLGLQASQDCERMVKERTAALQQLQKVSPFSFVLLSQDLPHQFSLETQTCQIMKKKCQHI